MEKESGEASKLKSAVDASRMAENPMERNLSRGDSSRVTRCNSEDGWFARFTNAEYTKWKCCRDPPAPNSVAGARGCYKQHSCAAKRDALRSTQFMAKDWRTCEEPNLSARRRGNTIKLERYFEAGESAKAV